MVISFCLFVTLSIIIGLAVLRRTILDCTNYARSSSYDSFAFIT